MWLSPHRREQDIAGTVYTIFSKFIYAIVGVGSSLWLWDYAEIAMKITTKAVAKYSPRTPCNWRSRHGALSFIH